MCSSLVLFFTINFMYVYLECKDHILLWIALNPNSIEMHWEGFS